MNVPCRPLRVALVEDEAILATQLEILIEDSGHRVVASAISRPEAEAIVASSIDLAFVDIHLADGPTGIEVARMLAGRGVPVVFLTANVRRIPDDHAGALGAIGKPYTEAGMAAALVYLGAVLDGARPAQAPPALLLAGMVAPATGIAASPSV